MQVFNMVEDNVSSLAMRSLSANKLHYRVPRSVNFFPLKTVAVFMHCVNDKLNEKSVHKVAHQLECLC